MNTLERIRTLAVEWHGKNLTDARFAIRVYEIMTKVCEDCGCEADCIEYGCAKNAAVAAPERLIAAAPDLLAMCEAVLSLLDGDHDGSQQYEDMRAYMADQIRAAIAKARGSEVSA